VITNRQRKNENNTCAVRPARLGLLHVGPRRSPQSVHPNPWSPQRDNRHFIWVLGMHHPAAGATRRCPVQPSTPLGPDQVNISLFWDGLPWPVMSIPMYESVQVRPTTYPAWMTEAAKLTAHIDTEWVQRDEFSTLTADRGELGVWGSRNEVFRGLYDSSRTRE
jgi:hypothetical protein